MESGSSVVEGSVHTGGRKYFALLQSAQLGCGTYKASYSLCAGFLFLGKGCRGVKLNNSLHLISRLRMSGDKFLQPLYSFTVSREKILPYVYT